MRTIAILISAIIVLMGLVFLIASADGGTVPRMVAGGAMCGTGIFLIVYITRRKSGSPDGTGTIEQKIDLTGAVKLQEMKCSKCGGSLASKDVVVRAGAIFISCPYCRSEYQIEEAPKW